MLIKSGVLADLGRHVSKSLPNAKIAAVVTDDNVKNFYLDEALTSLSCVGFDSKSYSIAPGDDSKCIRQFSQLLNWLAEQGLTRADVVIALGGGVVGDLAGFAAATYKRGVPLVLAPTSLLAMADACVGGKTAINLPAGKNLAGAFYHPALVFRDVKTLQTLPESDFSNGLAEIIKHGMVGCGDLLEKLAARPLDIEAIISKSVAVKLDIVNRDIFDQEERMLLNFGHTIGHAVEKLSNYAVPHGAAVAIGMAVETRAAVALGFCPPKCLETLEKLLLLHNLPNKSNFLAAELLDAVKHDKKRDGAGITVTVPVCCGRARLKIIPTESLLRWIEVGLI